MTVTKKIKDNSEIQHYVDVINLFLNAYVKKTGDENYDKFNEAMKKHLAKDIKYAKVDTIKTLVNTNRPVTHTGIHIAVKDFINKKYIDNIGHIDVSGNTWTFKHAGYSAYYCLYYPKDGNVVPCYVKVVSHDNEWTQFECQSIRRESKNVFAEGTLFTTDNSEDIILDKNLIYISAKAVKKDKHKEVNIHNYIFYVHKDLRDKQKYIFGAFCRVRKGTAYPSAGICLLKRLHECNNADAAKLKCREDIPPAVNAILFNLRNDFKHAWSHNLTELPNEENIKGLDFFADTWQGNYLYTGRIRQILLNIQPSGHAIIKYSEGHGRIVTVKGFIKLGTGNGQQLYGEFLWNEDDPYTSRMFFCLKFESGTATLAGCYSGFTDDTKIPFSGSISFTKSSNPQIKDITTDEQKNTNCEDFVKEIRNAYQKYLDLPEKCLTLPLQTVFHGKIKTEPKGRYYTYSIGRDKTEIVCYPLIFENGICTSYGRRPNNTYTAIVDNYEREDYIWLHFSPDAEKRKTILSFHFDEKTHMESKYFVGMSFRLNDKRKFQAKKEIIIADPSDDNSKFKLFKEKDSHYNLNELFIKYPVLQSLLWENLDDNIFQLD